MTFTVEVQDSAKLAKVLGRGSRSAERALGAPAMMAARPFVR
jgi:hypothetical protein